jgi:hypothetical protein
MRSVEKTMEQAVQTIKDMEQTMEGIQEALESSGPLQHLPDIFRFKELPKEIRCLIWRLNSPPRIVLISSNDQATTVNGEV